MPPLTDVFVAQFWRNRTTNSGMNSAGPLPFPLAFDIVLIISGKQMIDNDVWIRIGFGEKKN
jgi:hypothetical protein